MHVAQCVSRSRRAASRSSTGSVKAEESGTIAVPGESGVVRHCLHRRPSFLPSCAFVKPQRATSRPHNAQMGMLRLQLAGQGGVNARHVRSQNGWARTRISTLHELGTARRTEDRTWTTRIMPLVVLEARLYPLGSLISLTVLWGYPMGTSTRNIWIYGFGLSTSRHPWTTASDHHSGWSNLQEKVGREST